MPTGPSPFGQAIVNPHLDVHFADRLDWELRGLTPEQIAARYGTTTNPVNGYGVAPNTEPTYEQKLALLKLDASKVSELGPKSSDVVNELYKYASLPPSQKAAQYTKLAQLLESSAASGEVKNHILSPVFDSLVNDMYALQLLPKDEVDRRAGGFEFEPFDVVSQAAQTLGLRQALLQIGTTTVGANVAAAAGLAHLVKYVGELWDDTLLESERDRRGDILNPTANR